MNDIHPLEDARKRDAEDPLNGFRARFHIPQHNGQDSIYFTGNSLGCMPKEAKRYIEEELEDWASLGVEGHFESRRPWVKYHEFFSESLGRIVGAHPHEVVAMGSLTANLHLLMASFYRPEGSRTKILCEAKAFPSDRYALESQLKIHGLDPEKDLIIIRPREGEHLLRTEDILEAIETNGDRIATVLMGGVNYYSGQLLDMKTITDAGHKAGAIVGFDLAHAAGNVPLSLHDWGVDFAAWCSYKYMNSSPGGVSGIYVHERHCQDRELVQMAGWWGHDKESRFLMDDEFIPILTAERFQQSNAPVMTMAVHRAALDLFDEAGMEALRAKSLQLTAYLEQLILSVAEETEGVDFEIITPSEAEQRGCQLSILSHGVGKALFDALTEKGVIADWREPNVIRVAPVPLYNSYEDCWRFADALKRSLQELAS